MPSARKIAMEQSMHHPLATTAGTFPSCQKIEEATWHYVGSRVGKIIEYCCGRHCCNHKEYYCYGKGLPVHVKSMIGR